MVKLEEIGDDVEILTEDSSDVSSVFSVDSQDSELSESLYERIAALKDVIPYHRRVAISNNASKAYDFSKSTVKLIGNVGWVLVTSAILLIVPLALEMERDAQHRQWEKEYKMQQEGAPSLDGAAQTLPPGF